MVAGGRALRRLRGSFTRYALMFTDPVYSDRRLFASCPETLVLYRMRPTVSVRVGSVMRGASDTAV